METLKTHSTKIKVLDRDEQRTVTGGINIVKYADGRTIMYSSTGSVIFYPDGRVQNIIYGQSSTWI